MIEQVGKMENPILKFKFGQKIIFFKMSDGTKLKSEKKYISFFTFLK